MSILACLHLPTNADGFVLGERKLLLLIELDNLAMVLIGPARIVAASLMSPYAFYGGR